MYDVCVLMLFCLQFFHYVSFLLNFFVIIFLLQIRHNVTSIASKRDNRCIRTHERCVADLREKEIKRTNDKKAFA